MIEVGNIVTLENNQEYLLLEECEKDGKKYIYAVRTLEDESLTDEYLVFEAIVQDGEEFLKVVEDQEAYEELIDEFKDIIADKILSSDFLKEEA